MDTTMTAVVKEFFTENDWKYDYDNSLSVFSSGVADDENSYRFFIVADDPGEVFSLRMSTDFYVPKQNKREVAEYLTRVNYHLVIGCMKMDYYDGEIVMNIAADFEDGQITPSMIKRSVVNCIATIKRFLPGIKAIVEQRKTALVAFDDIHSDEDEE